MATDNIFLDENFVAFMDEKICLDNIFVEFKSFIDNDLKDKEKNISISDMEVLFLDFYIKSRGAKNILEVGTFYGYSTLCLALAAGENSTITTIDLETIRPEKGLQFMEKAGVDNRVIYMTGKALDCMELLKNNGSKFDFIFIDADKINYENYFNLAADMLENKAAIILDNVLQEGDVFISDEKIVEKYSPKMGKVGKIIKMKKLLEKLLKDDKFNCCLLPIGDGLLFCEKK